MIEMKDISAVFFDAVGTLIEIRGSVGEVYRDIATHYGVDVDPRDLDRQFQAAFAAKSSQGSSAQTERQWWHELVHDVMAPVIPEEEFESYFAELYDYFGSSRPWLLYPDATVTLHELRAQGLRLGVISNFDSRLRNILNELGIGSIFEDIVLSWEAKAAKPDRKIYSRAVDGMGISPGQAMYVGDSVREDAEGARAAGLRPVLLDRNGLHTAWTNGLRIRSLSELTN